jgi:hypothetical protein
VGRLYRLRPRVVGGGGGGGGGSPSALNAPSTVKFVPRPHPFTDITAPSELPREFLETRYGIDTDGSTLSFTTTVTLTEQGSASANTAALQAEINAASTRPGHSKIRIPSGMSLWDPIIRKNVTGSYWLYIEWASLGVPEGTRVTPATMANAPTFFARGPVEGAGHCMQFDRAANRVRFVGIKFTAATGVSIYDMVTVEPKESSVEYGTDLANINDWIILDRILVQGNDAGTGTTALVRNGVRLDGRRCALIDSYIHQIGWAGTESHAVIAFNTPGPLKIVNNYMEGTSCCFFVGGVEPAYGVLNGRPSDIEFRRNVCSRRLTWNADHVSWDGQPGRGIKNSFETKNVLRILVEGNIIERSWPSGQQGMIVVVKSGEGNESGPGAGAGQGSEDLTIRYNLVRDGTLAWNFQGIDDFSSLHVKRLACYHNLSYGIGNYIGDARAFYFTHHITSLYVRFNTVVQSRAAYPCQMADAGIGTDGFVGLSDNFVFTDNLLGCAYWAMSSGSNHLAGVDEWAEAATRVFERNLLVELSPDFLPFYPASTQLAATFAAVGFQNAAANDYRLAAGSAFKGDGALGADPGCAMDDVELATAGVP